MLLRVCAPHNLAGEQYAGSGGCEIPESAGGRVIAWEHEKGLFPETDEVQKAPGRGY